MTDATPIEKLAAEQDVLQAAYEVDNLALQEARIALTESSDALVTFNHKYGRVLQMFKEG